MELKPHFEKRVSLQENTTTPPASGYTKLTWWQLKQYNPVMDSETSAEYLAEYLLDENKWFNIKTTVLNEWKSKLEEYNKQNNL